jgi:hypothetical protein
MYDMRKTAQQGDSFDPQGSIHLISQKNAGNRPSPLRSCSVLGAATPKVDDQNAAIDCDTDIRY